MAKAGEVYVEKCADAGCAPRSEIARILESWDSKTALRIELPGNSLELFEQRLGDLDVIALVQTILHACTDQLESLNLSFHTLTDKAAVAVALLFEDAGEYKCGLRALNLRGNDIGQAGCRSLCTAIKRNTTLRELSLNGNPVGNEGGMFVASMLAQNAALEALDLGNTEQGTESVIALAAVLKQNSTLRDLDLENPRLFSLGEESTYQLAKMLAVNRSLVRVRLGKHKVRDDGARMLAQHLSSNDVLEVLDLRCNEVGISGAESFAALLMRGTSSLHSLDLASNKVHDDGALAIGTALRRCRTLTSLDLRRNGIGDDGLGRLLLAPGW